LCAEMARDGANHRERLNPATVLGSYAASLLVWLWGRVVPRLVEPYEGFDVTSSAKIARNGYLRAPQARSACSQREAAASLRSAPAARPRLSFSLTSGPSFSKTFSKFHEAVWFWKVTPRIPLETPRVPPRCKDQEEHDMIAGFVPQPPLDHRSQDDSSEP
jgi:hypothetical protein